jgi:Ca2+-binding EF-hand superfamily protein
MKRMVAMVLSCGFVLASIALPAQAQDEDRPQRRRPQRDPEAMFKRLDANTDNKLSKDEFLAMARNEEQKPRVEQMFARADANKDGSVTLEEFKTAQTQQRDPAVAFKELDKNEDKKLSKEEFMARAQTDQQKARMEQAFARVDENKDGSISLEEYTKMASQRRGQRGERGEGDGERRRPQRDGDNNN